MRILVIEDYAPLRLALVKGLREAGFAVDASGDGDEGGWYASGTAYDVIILDLMLPGKSGLDILSTLRARGGTTHVIILTARDSVADRVAGLDHGADDYLVKPFAFAELLARVRALVRRSYQAKNPIIAIGALRIDTVTKQASHDAVALDLTAREYSLLELLALRAGEVVQRSEIWEHLYEFDADAGSNVVDVYVGYLRRKLDAAGAPRLIHTRRGLGYVLGDES